jgi:hypothetical protein
MRDERALGNLEWGKSSVGALDQFISFHPAASYVRATSEESRLRALSLYVVRSIVERYGGSMNVDLSTDTQNIKVPKEYEGKCFAEIEELFGKLLLQV